MISTSQPRKQLRRWSEGLIEAAWLVALVAVPLHFNVYAEQMFEPNKSALLRTLALAIVGGLLLIWRALPNGGYQRRSLFREPLLAPAVMFGLAVVVATLFSISPGRSFWGSIYWRLHGTYFELSLLAVLVAGISILRRLSQIDRALTGILITATIVAGYAMMQRLGLDPFPWTRDVTWRVQSTLGGPTEAGAYLAMVIPILAARAIPELGGDVHGDRASRLAQGTVAGLAVAALIFTQGRAALIGLSVGLLAGALLLARIRWRWLASASLGVAVAGATCLFAVNLANGPLSGLRDMPYLGRLASVFEADAGSTGRERALIWNGVVTLLTGEEPLAMPSGSSDRLRPLRPLFGYGPETLLLAFPQVYPTELFEYDTDRLAPELQIDQAHNQILHTFFTAGALGVISEIGLFVAGWAWGLRSLGYLGTRRRLATFFVAAGLGGLLGASTLAAWQGIGFAGLGFGAGIVFATLIVLAVDALRPGIVSSPEAVTSRAPVLTVGLIAALLAHFVETQLGIAVAPTRLLAMMCLALLVSLTRPPEPRADSQLEWSRRQNRHGGQRPPESWTPRPFSGLLVAVALSCWVLVFFSVPMRLLQPTRASLLAVGMVVLCVLAVGWLARPKAPTSDSKSASPLLGYALAALIPLGFLVGWISLTMRLTQATPGVWITTGFYAIILAIVGVAAFWLSGETGIGPGWHRPAALLLAVLGLVGLAAYWTNLRVIHANVYYQEALQATKAGRHEPAERAFQAALARAPEESRYALNLGLLLWDQANPSPSQDRLMLAKPYLERAVSVGPWLPINHLAVARLYWNWAEQTAPASERAAYARRADAEFAEAARLNPRDYGLFTQWGEFRFRLLGDYAGGAEKLQRAIDLAPAGKRPYRTLGALYFRQGQAAPDDREESYTRALEAYRSALEENPNELDTAVAIGLLEADLGHRDAAIRAYEHALSLDTAGTYTWQIDRDLAVLYLAQGDAAQAVSYLTSAFENAPDTERAGLGPDIARVCAAANSAEPICRGQPAPQS